MVNRAVPEVSVIIRISSMVSSSSEKGHEEETHYRPSTVF